MTVTTVAAYAAPAAKAPLERTTIERRAGRRARRPDRHQVRRHLPLRHPPGRDEWGEALFPMVPGHEIAGIVAEVGSGVTRFAVGDRVGVGCMVDSCRECENCQAGAGAVLPQRQRRHVQRPSTRTAQPTYGGYSHARSSSTRTSSCASPRASPSTRPRRCCARASPRTRRCKHWNAGPGKKVADRRPGRPRPHGRQDRARDGRRGDRPQSQSLRKQEDGLRLGADHYYATSDAETFEELAGTLRPDRRHGLGPAADRTPTSRLLRTDGAMVNVGAPAGARRAQPVLRSSAAARPSPAPAIGGIRRDPGDARLLRRARLRRRDRD